MEKNRKSCVWCDKSEVLMVYLQWHRDGYTDVYFCWDCFKTFKKQTENSPHFKFYMGEGLEKNA